MLNVQGQCEFIQCICDLWQSCTCISERVGCRTIQTGKWDFGTLVIYMECLVHEFLVYDIIIATCMGYSAPLMDDDVILV